MKKLRLTMLRTEKGKDDSPTAPVLTYEAGLSYEVGEGLFDAFVRDLRCARPEPELVDDESEALDEDSEQQKPGEGRVTKIVGPAETKPAGRGRKRKG